MSDSAGGTGTLFHTTLEMREYLRKPKTHTFEVILDFLGVHMHEIACSEGEKAAGGRGDSGDTAETGGRSSSSPRSRSTSETGTERTRSF